jgi:hypothetical protein
VLTVHGVNSTEVSLDGRVILAASDGAEGWKSGRRVDLSPFLSRGKHVLAITVGNRKGPPLLLAYCRPLGIATGKQDWETREDASVWRPVRSVDETGKVAERDSYPPASKAVARSAWFLAGWFLAGGLAAWGLGTAATRFPAFAARWLLASRFRWLLMGSCVVLWANNLGKIPNFFGFDAYGHIDYVRFLLRTLRLPLASDGWSMYHPPFFYTVAAVVFKGGRLQNFSREVGYEAVQFVVFLCGVLQIEVAFRTMRRVFPGREDLQSLGTLVAGFTPVNLYMCQGMTNEPMAGLLGAVTLWLCMSLLAMPRDAVWRRSLFLLGATCGLALLTKVSALFMMPVVVAAVVTAPRTSGSAGNSVARRLAIVLGTAALVSGWFYLRNVAAFGKPFIGNWDIAVTKGWWQRPGYRTPGFYLSFGESVRNPVYSGLSGFWDSIHSTLWLDGYLSGIMPKKGFLLWNGDLMIAGAWLAFLPMAAMASGVWRILSGGAGKRETPFLHLALLAVASHLGALAALSLLAPTYSSVKASYALAILPCFGMLAAAGADLWLRSGLTRSLVWGSIVCWAAASYGAYFIP